MYWDDYVEARLIFRRETEPIARKEHKCCECGRTIKIGEKYSYFVGLWGDYYSYDDNQFDVFKTCLECEEDWAKIICVFHENGEYEACRVYTALREAIRDAFHADFLTPEDLLVKEWLDIMPEEDGEESCEKEKAFSQMRRHSRPMI